MRCVEVVEPGYEMTYTAVPNSGFVFVGWEDGTNHLFAGETAQSVVINTNIYKDNPVFNSVIGSNKAFYLKPVFALENYQTAPLGLPALFWLDCENCDHPKPIDWPVSITQTMDLWVFRGNWEEQEEFVLAEFIMYAKDYDYKIENLKAHLTRVEGAENLARIDGLREGQIIRKGSQVVFKLLTKHQLAAVGITAVGEFSFDIAGTSASFNAILSVNMGSGCDAC